MIRRTTQIGYLALIMFLALGGLSCGAQGPAVHPRARPRARPRPPSVEAQVRTDMRRWVQLLKKEEDFIDLATLLAAPKEVVPPYPRAVSCRGKREFFKVVSSPELLVPKGSASPAKASGPALFIFSTPVPAGAERPKGVTGPWPPGQARCLVRLARRKGRLTLVADPVSLRQEDGPVTAAAFQRRGHCHLLAVTTTYELDDREGSGGKQREETRRFYRWRPGAAKSIGEYVLSAQEEGGNAYENGTRGTAEWVTVAGRALLVYRATSTESSQSSGHRSKSTTTVSVESLTKTCELELLDPGELQRLRKTTGGDVLPARQISPDDDDS